MSGGILEVDSSQKSDAYTPIHGHKANEARATQDHLPDVEWLMLKLHHTDYYTEPAIQELAEKERADVLVQFNNG